MLNITILKEGAPMIITIDETASEPLYKQIHDQVIAGIATGQLDQACRCLL